MRADTQRQDPTTRVIYDLCSMIIQILRSPPLPLSFPTLAAGPAVCTRQPSPAAFASLFLGISVAMMLFGFVTFFIGFFLMPLVIGLVMLFYFIGIIYNLSELGRAILWPGCPPNSGFPPDLYLFVASTVANLSASTDWGPAVVAVAMFILLSPGLLFQIPARTRVIEFGNMYTSAISILVHAILFFCIYTILIVAFGIHIQAA